MNDHSLKKEIMNEIRSVYKGLPDEFYAWTLFQRVIYYIGAQFQKNVYPETVMRYFRTMRETGEIDCECLNRKSSLYMKGMEK